MAWEAGEDPPRHHAFEEVKQAMFVRSWMTTPAVSIASEATLHEASLLMDRKRIRRLPVVDEPHTLVGIVTRSDIEAEVGKSFEGVSAKRHLKDVRVAHVMSRNPISVSPKDTLDFAAQIMLRKKISGLPVVDDGRLVGMVTESDLFYAFCTILGFTEKGGRVVLSLQPDADILGQLQKAVGRFSVKGVVSYYNPESKSLEAVVRLRGRKSGK